MSKLRILVVDDDQRNLDSAQRLLGDEHDLTTCTSHEEAVKLIDTTIREIGSIVGKGPSRWDVVLSDHNMPAWASASSTRRGEMMMVGWQIVLLAALNGAQYCAVVTAGNHHDDVTSAMLDPLGKAYWAYIERDPEYTAPFVINGAKVGFWHDPNEDDPENGKGWDKVLRVLLRS